MASNTVWIWGRPMPLGPAIRPSTRVPRVRGMTIPRASDRWPRPDWRSYVGRRRDCVRSPSSSARRAKPRLLRSQTQIGRGFAILSMSTVPKPFLCETTTSLVPGSRLDYLLARRRPLDRHAAIVRSSHCLSQTGSVHRIPLACCEGHPWSALGCPFDQAGSGNDPFELGLVGNQFLREVVDEAPAVSE